METLKTRGQTEHREQSYVTMEGRCEVFNILTALKNLFRESLINANHNHFLCKIFLYVKVNFYGLQAVLCTMYNMTGTLYVPGETSHYLEQS